MILEPSEDYKAALTNTLSLKGRKLQKYNLLKFRVICAVLLYVSNEWLKVSEETLWYGNVSRRSNLTITN